MGVNNFCASTSIPNTSVLNQKNNPNLPEGTVKGPGLRPYIALTAERGDPSPKYQGESNLVWGSRRRWPKDINETEPSTKESGTKRSTRCICSPSPDSCYQANFGRPANLHLQRHCQCAGRHSLSSRVVSIKATTKNPKLLSDKNVLYIASRWRADTSQREDTPFIKV